MEVLVKVCGLRHRAEVVAAREEGAAFVGMVHYAPSPRHVDLSTAGELRAEAGEGMKVVMVMVKPDDMLLDAVMEEVCPDMIQLHGGESDVRVKEVGERTGVQVVRAVQVGRAGWEAKVQGSVGDVLLLEPEAPKGATRPGGHGRAGCWQEMRGVGVAKPWFVAGGLTAHNVLAACRESGARWVDVSGGVESRLGVKDEEKIRHFLRTVRAGADE